MLLNQKIKRDLAEMNSNDAKMSDKLSDFISNKKMKIIVLFLLSLVVTYFAFSPAIQFNFAHHDQYRYFNHDKSSAYHDPQFQWLVLIGRPIAAWIEQIIFQHAFFLEDLKVFRVCCCIIISMLILASTYCFSKRLFTTLESFLISCALFTLPAIQNFVVMTNLANLFAIGLAFSSYFLYDRHFHRSENSAYSKRFSFFLLGSSISFFASLFIYPALAYSFLVPFFAELLFRRSLDKENIKQLVVRPFLFLGVHSLIYFSIVKLVVQRKNPFSSMHPKEYSFSINGFWTKTLTNFISEIFPAASNLWNIYPSQLIAWGVGLSLIACCVYKYREIKKESHSIIGFVCFISFLLAFLVLSCFVFFLKDIDFVLYRLLFVLSVMLFLVLVYVCKQIFSSYYKLHLALLGGISALAVMLCNQHVFQTALNAHMEITYIASQIRSGSCKQFSRVHFVVPPYSRGFTGNLVRTDEFNCPSTTWFQDIPFMVNCVFNCLSEKKAVVTTSSREGEPFMADEQTLIIYMKDLNGLH